MIFTMYLAIRAQLKAPREDCGRQTVLRLRGYALRGRKSLEFQEIRAKMTGLDPLQSGAHAAITVR